LYPQRRTGLFFLNGNTVPAVAPDPDGPGCPGRRRRPDIWTKSLHWPADGCGQAALGRPPNAGESDPGPSCASRCRQRFSGL